MKPGLPTFRFGRLIALNLLRRPGRSVAAVLGVVLAAGTAFAGGMIALGVNHALDTGLSRLGADLMVVPAGTAMATHTALVMGEPTVFYMDEAVTEQVRAVSGVQQAAPQVFVETLSSAACCTGRLFLVGFDPARDFTVKPWLEYGLGRSLAPDEILVGDMILALAGTTMKFYGQEFRVAARLERSGMGMDETVFLPVGAVQKMAQGSLTLAEKPLTIPPGQVSAVMVKATDSARSGEVARQIESAIPGVAVVTTGQVTRDVVRDLRSLMTFLLPLAIGILLVSVALFFVLFFAIAAERAREIGLLRTIGATAPQAAGLLVGEALLLGLLGGVAGVAAGLGVFALFVKAILVSYTLPFLWPGLLQQVLLGLAIAGGAAGLAALAAAFPAWRVARQDPFFALHIR